MFFKKTVRIVIKNPSLSIEAKTGANLYQILVDEKVIPQTLCKGNGLCGKCKVHITQRYLARPNKQEQLVLAKVNLDSGFRLACQTTVKEDMVVDVSEITATAIPNDIHFRSVTKTDPAEIPEPPTLATEEKIITAPATPQDTKEIKQQEMLDGLLLFQDKGQLRYFLYSAAIERVSQEGAKENVVNLSPYIENGMLSDYVHDVLKIKEIDRIVILSDEVVSDGENLFDVASYKPFDIGAMPCELLRPLHGLSDLKMFLRLISVKEKKRLVISLDNLQYTFYLAADSVVRIPNGVPNAPVNLFDVLPAGNNPVTEISDDLKTIKVAKQFIAPDSIPLQLLMKVAAGMVKMKLTDAEFRIFSRNRLDKSVPLEHVIKILQTGESNAFALDRDKDSSLIITQDMLSTLAMARRFTNYAIEYTESHLGSIEEIVVMTPFPVQGLLDAMTDINMIPRRHESVTLNSSGDSAVNAIRLFKEQDIRAYIQKNLGSYVRGE